MIKIVFCLRRLPGLSREEFQRYWREVHAPLVARHAEILGIRRYVQRHALGDDAFGRIASARGGAASYDGVAELWVERLIHDPEQVTAARQANQALLEDEARFIDLPQSPIFYVDDYEVIIGRDSPVSRSAFP